jgi:biotin carboxyl carrier protein
MDRFPSQPSNDAASVVLRTQAAMLARPRLKDAATALAVELAQAFGCLRVSIGLLDQGVLTVVATSHGDEPDARRETAASIAAAMNEALDLSATIAHPQPAPGLAPVAMAHQMLAPAGAVCTVPLKGASALVGAVTLERANAFSSAEIALCEDAACFAGPVLELRQRAQLSPWKLFVANTRERFAGKGSRVAAAAAAFLLLVIIAVPMPYTVSAPARLEGSMQRAIVAAADGYLQQANVRAGDRVREGQVLAELATQDLVLERRRRESELSQHENALRAAQARNDRAQMVISQSRAAEAQAMLALADAQLERARIVAPFDGVVIKGDLTQTLGAPVQRGEVLLTVAPNDSYRLIVEVDESDIASIQPGQAGQLALAAVPERALSFTTRRIGPVAAAADARNYFEVEAALDAQGANLRPGLSGVARIEAGNRTLAWQLTHRALNWLRLALWSVGL